MSEVTLFLSFTSRLRGWFWCSAQRLGQRAAATPPGQTTKPPTCSLASPASCVTVIETVMLHLRLNQYILNVHLPKTDSDLIQQTNQQTNNFRETWFVLLSSYSYSVFLIRTVACRLNLWHQRWPTLLYKHQVLRCSDIRSKLGFRTR